MKSVCSCIGYKRMTVNHTYVCMHVLVEQAINVTVIHYQSVIIYAVNYY